MDEKKDLKEKETESSKKNKFLDILTKKGVRFALLYVSIFGITAGAAYWITPFLDGSLEVKNYSQPNENKGLSGTDKLMAKLTTLTAVEANINDLSFSYLDKEGKTNEVSFKEDSTLYFSMPSTNDISFYTDTTITLKTLGSDIAPFSKSLTALLSSGSLFISLNNDGKDNFGPKIRYDNTNDYDTLFENLMDIFGPDFNEIDPSVYSFLDSILGNFGNFDSPDINVEFLEDEKASTENKHVFTVNLEMDQKPYAINLETDKDYNLTKVLANLDFSGTTINIDIDLTLNGDVAKKIVSYIPSDISSYTSVINLHGVFSKICNIVKAERFSLSLDGSLTNKKLDNGLTLSLDSAIDYKNNDYRVDLDLKDQKDLNNKDAFYQNIRFALLPNLEKKSDAYFDYNGVMKAKMDYSVLEALISRISNLSSINNVSFDSQKLLKLFSFVTESEVMKEVSNGRYQTILNMVDDLTLKDNFLEAKIHLNKLGFGENSLITITAGENLSNEEYLKTENKPNIFKINLTDISFSDYSFSGSINIGEDFTSTQEKIKFVALDTYHNMSALPSIYDQIEGVVNSKEAGLAINASMEGIPGTKLSLNGNLNVDIDDTLVNGSVVLKEENANFTKNHLVNFGLNQNEAKVQYTDEEEKETNLGTLAKFSFSTFTDLFSFLKILPDDTNFNNRFIKGLNLDLSEIALSLSLKDIIANNFTALATTKVLISSSLNDEESVFVLNGALFGFEEGNNITIALTYENGVYSEKDNNRQLKAIELRDLSLGSIKINASIGLTSYQNKSTLPEVDDSKYNDFSHVGELLKAGIKTASDFNTYDIHGEMAVTLWTTDIISLDMDFVANYTDSGWQYYLKLSNIPLIPALNSKYSMFTGYRRSVQIFYKEDKIYLLGENPFGEHGYLTEEDRINGKKHDWSESNKGIYSSSYFKKNSNLLPFILGDVLNLQPYYLSKIASSETSNSGLDINALLSGSFLKEKLATEKVLEKTTYDPLTHDYGLYLDIGTLLNTSFVAKMILGAKTNGTYLSQIAMEMMVFAGVKINFAFSASLNNVSTGLLSDEINSSINNLLSALEGEEVK